MGVRIAIVGRDIMRILVNGKWREQDRPLTISGLLESLSLQPQRVAVELNKEIVPRGRFGETSLADEDELEIVTLVGGG